MVYELFASTLPSPAFTASDVLDLAPPIADRLRRYSPMKTRSKIRIAGTLIPCAARSFARSSRNGCGTSGWNWGRSSLRQIYAQPNLPKPVSSSLSRELHPFPLSILAAWRSTRYRFSMVLPNGHVLLLREAFPVLLLLHSRMGRCVVPPTIHCIHTNGAPERDGSLRVLYAARIGHCRTWTAAAPSVKKATPRSNHGG